MSREFNVIKALEESASTSQTQYRRRIRSILSDKEFNIGFDKLTVDKNGVVHMKRAFFYQREGNANTIAQKIVKQFKKHNADVHILHTSDEWKQYPKTSYFGIKFKVDFKDEEQQTNEAIGDYTTSVVMIFDSLDDAEKIDQVVEGVVAENYGQVTGHTPNYDKYSVITYFDNPYTAQTAINEVKNQAVRKGLTLFDTHMRNWNSET